MSLLGFRRRSLSTRYSKMLKKLFVQAGVFFLIRHILNIDFAQNIISYCSKSFYSHDDYYFESSTIKITIIRTLIIEEHAYRCGDKNIIGDFIKSGVGDNTWQQEM